MSNRLSDFFNRTIGVKQGCALSLTLFGLYIDELEDMVAEFVKEECVEEVAIGNVVIMLLLYENNVVLFANILGDAQKLMKALEKICMHTKLSVHSSKTKIMLVKSQKRDKSCIMYNNEPLECMESFKYLGLEFPSSHRWMNVLLAAWRRENEHIVHLKTHAIMEILSVGPSRNTFSTLWSHRCFSMG